MPTPSRKLANGVVWLMLMAALTIRAQDSAGDGVVKRVVHAKSITRELGLIDHDSAIPARESIDVV